MIKKSSHNQTNPIAPSYYGGEQLHTAGVEGFMNY